MDVGKESNARAVAERVRVRRFKKSTLMCNY
jgi:hypothetical protein